MIYLYRIAFPVLTLLALPYYTLRMIRRGGYGFKACYRLGLFPSLQPKTKAKKRIWIQAVSVGELSSLSKILSVLCADEKTEVVLTGTTSTGLLMADKKYRNQVLAQGPFPLDWWIFSCMAWFRIKPDLIITVDSELWPEHFHQAAIRGVPALVINARLSDRTFSRLSASSIARKLLLPRGIEILTTSENQRSRWLELGLPKDRVQVVGNLKVDAITPSEKAPNTPAELKKEFGFGNDSLVLAGISTWPGEEELLVETLQALHTKEIDARLLLVPRHAERRAKIASMLQQSGVAHHLRTSSNEAPEETLIYLADTTGELGNLIRCADLAFGGKTLPPNQGGQNPIEPIALGIPLVLGPNFQNFRQTCGDLLAHQAIEVTESAEEAKSALISLALNKSYRENLSKRALDWMDAQGSPSDQTLEKIFQLLSS